MDQSKKTRTLTEIIRDTEAVEAKAKATGIDLGGIEHGHAGVLPPSWVRRDLARSGLQISPSMAGYWRFDGLLALVGARVEQDGKRWLHVSVSHTNRAPTYAELQEVYELLMKGLTAYQLFVPPDQHVNYHPYVLHLWACMDGPVTPDFTRGLGMI